jgi:hypothetical protein
VYVAVDVKPPHAAALVVVVSVGRLTGGITRTSSTKSAVDRYELTAVEQAAPPTNATVTVDVNADVLNAPVNSEFVTAPPEVVTTVAAVGYVRHVLLEPPPDGLPGFVSAASSVHAGVTNASTIATISRTPRCAKTRRVVIIKGPPGRWEYSEPPPTDKKKKSKVLRWVETYPVVNL